MRGAVNSPAALTYVAGKNLDYYIRAAGGGSPTADVDRAYVTQANGQVESRNSHFFFFHSTPKPGPGSKVFVPTENPADRVNWGQIASTTTSILGSLVAIWVILKK